MHHFKIIYKVYSIFKIIISIFILLPVRSMLYLLSGLELETGEWYLIFLLYSHFDFFFKAKGGRSDLVNSSVPLKWMVKWGLSKLILCLWCVCMREREMSLLLTDVTPLTLHCMTWGEQVCVCECDLEWIFVQRLSSGCYVFVVYSSFQAGLALF